MNKFYSSQSNLNGKKLAKAIHRLENICSQDAKEIIDCLNEFDGLPYIDILIKTGLDQETLERKLHYLAATGILRIEHNLYSKEYYLNRAKMYRLQSICKVLVKDLKLAA